MTKLVGKRLMTGWFPGVPTTDGAGVNLTRMIGTGYIDMLDPFLMLDRIDSDDPDSYIAGFPDHPHRGFDTVTILHEGLMCHKDSAGNEGIIGPGAVQWMTAGRGIIHSEIPKMVEGRLSGFQLWVNLPSQLKMSEPTYQDISANEINISKFDGGHVRVIAGTYGNTMGVACPKTEVRILDLILESKVAWSIIPSIQSNLFLCLYEGSVNAEVGVGHTRCVKSPSILVFDGVGKVEIESGNLGAKILYCEGDPLNEPVARKGPFVMNTQDELEQAAKDYNEGRLAGVA